MKYLQIILIIILLLCLAPMPYEYYTLVRFMSMVVFGVMAYKYYQVKKEGLAIVFGVLVLLFQPFIKIALGRTMWNVVDIATAVLLITTLTIKDWKINKN